jgi:hypothetical protein
MGCMDIYCFICGNSCHGLDKYSIDDIKNALNNTDLADKQIKKIKDTSTLMKDILTLYKNTQWMEHATMLLVNDDIIHGLNETACNVNFSSNDNRATQIGYQDTEWLYGVVHGIFIHTDCWKFIKNKYKIELKFSHLPPLKYRKQKFFDINYGEIEKYWEQLFPFLNVLIEKKSYLCSSPLKNDKNITQIKKNIKYLKLKKDAKRQGPPISATFYKTGDIKLGNNKNFWIINNGKWIEIKELPQILSINIKNISTKQIKWLSTIGFMAQETKEPILLIESSYNKKTYKIGFILLESMKLKVKKYFK